jgi:hypothetical protein
MRSTTRPATTANPASWAARQRPAAFPVAAMSRVALMYPPMRMGTSISDTTRLNGSLVASGAGAYCWTVSVCPALVAAFWNWTARSTGARSLMDGTTIKVSEVPEAIRPSPTDDCACATTCDEPTMPSGTFRGASSCTALTRHSANRAWATSTPPSATRTFPATPRLRDSPGAAGDAGRPEVVSIVFLSIVVTSPHAGICARHRGPVRCRAIPA